MSITCVIADDHPPVLQFLSRYLSNNGITITASARDGDEALRKILETKPTVAVLDARMPRVSGLDVLRALTESKSSTRVILYTGYGDDALLSDALDAGVAGVLDKEAPPDDLVRAIKIVAEGGTYLDPIAAAALIQQRRRNRNRELTQRERDVLRLLAEGNTNNQIGAVLTISPQTVRTHVQKAMEKLGATTRVQAVAIALRGSPIRQRRPGTLRRSSATHEGAEEAASGRTVEPRRSRVALALRVAAARHGDDRRAAGEVLGAAGIAEAELRSGL
jgi:DNA-binding NarL/FixJ family response regulator